MNLDPALLPRLPVTAGTDSVEGSVIDVSVAAVIPAKKAGNGLGRPAAAWCLDLQLTAADGVPLRFGDLVAISDIDARYNIGYRRDWMTIGLLVHGSSPLPGHGPGITVILTGPAQSLRPQDDGAGHAGLTASMLMGKATVNRLAQNRGRQNRGRLNRGLRTRSWERRRLAPFLSTCRCQKQWAALCGTGFLITSCPPIPGLSRLISQPNSG